MRPKLAFACILATIAASQGTACTLASTQASPAAETRITAEQPRLSPPQIEVRTLTASPTPPTEATLTGTPKDTLGPEPTDSPMVDTVPPVPRVITLTIVYDNNPYQPNLETAWGFACLVQTQTGTVLFDTGGEGDLLLRNLARLGADTGAIQAVVLSHIHGDHVGGVSALLDTGIRPRVYAPQTFPASFKDGVRSRTEVVEVSGPTEVFPGVRTTGEVGFGIVEQALVVESAEGLVIVTGCAHPGVIQMVRGAIGRQPEPVALLLGGFHLGGAGRQTIEQITAQLMALRVRQVAPVHCSGDLARAIFSESFGDRCFLAGVGWSITLPGQ